tara:strand:+ start:452 stop:1471 length:1020 start_codon:yes stop_codon:yes gene_type:complete
MAIDWKILGTPGADNALLVTIDTGQSLHRILFDCGEGCLNSLRPSVIQSIDHLCFSHFHMDHVSGFDTFFRHNYNRPEIPVQVWGPPDTIDLMAHRFQSFTWNLHAEQPGEWLVHNISPSKIESARFYTKEAFGVRHPDPSLTLIQSEIHRSPEFTIEAALLPHHNISSAAYRVIEADRFNVCAEALQKSGLKPGPWITRLTDTLDKEDASIAIDGKEHSLKTLRSELLKISKGSSIAYLTDFRVEPGSTEWNNLADWLKGTDVLVCECQYLKKDQPLAQRNGHMTSDRVGQLAEAAGVKSLVLQHLSRRYNEDDWATLLSEATEEFTGASFPPHWTFE